MYKFEEHKKLAEFIEEMAHTGKAPSEWTKFIEELNIALTIPVVSQQRELLAFVKEVSELHYGHGLAQITKKAENLLKANCG